MWWNRQVGWLGLLGALLAPSALAQATTPSESGLQEEVEVLLFQLNFLAMDRRDRPVTDLRPDEIEILDRRKRQDIAFLERNSQSPVPGIDEVAGDTDAASKENAPVPQAEPPVAGPRSIVLMFDHYASAPSARVQSVLAAERWVGSELRPGDRVSVVVFNGELHVTQSFTDDPLRLQQALSDAMALSTHAGFDREGDLGALVESMKFCRQHALPASCARRAGSAYEDERRREASALLQALTQIVRSVAPIPEIKSVVLFSNGVSRTSSADVRDAAQAALGDQIADRMLEGTDPRMERRMEDLVTSASRSRVSIFTINPGGLSRAGATSAEVARATDQSVNRFRVDVYQRSARNLQASLTEIADRTGGLAYRSLDVLDSLTRVTDVSAGLYTVGYYPNRPDPSAPHEVKIRIRRKGVRAVWPREVPVVNPPPGLRGELLLDPGECRDGRRLLGLKLTIEVDSLSFESQGGQFFNNFSTYVQLLDPTGSQTIHRDFRFFNILYDKKEFHEAGLADPTIEQTLTVACRPLLVRSSAVDVVSGARIDLERSLPM